MARPKAGLSQRAVTTDGSRAHPGDAVHSKAAAQARVKPPGRVARGLATPNALLHARWLERMGGGRVSRAPGLLLQLQRLHGNRYTQRVVRLARHLGDESAGGRCCRRQEEATANPPSGAAEAPLRVAGTESEASPSQGPEKAGLPRVNRETPGTTVPLRRQVALAKKDMTGDFVELTSIDYALKRAGGPVALFKDSDFSGMGLGESLYIVAHGKVGQAGDVPTPVMIARLTHPTFGLKNSIQAIVFTSCHAGKGIGDLDIGSVINDLKAGLHARFPGIRIVGSRGPCAKSEQTGDEYTVVDKDKTVVVPGVGAKTAWGVVQTMLKVVWEPEKETLEAIQKLTDPSITEKADAASKATGTFFTAWWNAMRDPAGSPTLNAIKGGFFERYGDLPVLSTKLGVIGFTLTQKQVVEILNNIEKLAPLTLAKPMSVVTS